jgi:hypothetical protein
MADETAAAEPTATESAALPKPATPRRRAAKPRTGRTGQGRPGLASQARVEDVRERINGAELDLEEHVAGLSEQLADLAHRVERYAADSAAGTRDLVAGAGYAGARAGRIAGRQLASTARAVRDDPLPTMAAFGVLALIAMVVFSRRDARW